MSKALTISNTNTLPIIADEVNSYISKIANSPILSAEEEKALAVRLIQDKDLGAAKQLIMSQLRFVVHIARSYTGYGLPLADLVQEGNLGLMKAVKRFDPEKGVRLISFAVHWIRAEIHEYVIRNWRIVKVATTKAQRKLFFKLRSSKKQLNWFNPEEVDSIATRLDVKPETVVEMESRMHGHDSSFDMPNSSSADDDYAMSPADYIFDETATPEHIVTGNNQRDTDYDALHQSLSLLDDRSRSILRRRWLSDSKATLQELATEYNVSPERIRQIEKNAMNKVKKQMLEES